jgi:hypothetical protein
MNSNEQPKVKKYEINLAEGTEFINVEWLIKKMAQAIYPFVDTPPRVKTIKKIFKKQHKHNDGFTEYLGFGESLSLDDRVALRTIFSDSNLTLPDNWPIGLAFDEYEKYRTAFESSPKKPDWSLSAEYVNSKGESLVNQSNLENDYRNEFNQAAESKLINLIDAHSRHVRRLDPGVTLTKVEAITFLEKNYPRFSLVEVEITNSSEPLQTQPQSDNSLDNENIGKKAYLWREEARRLATELCIDLELDQPQCGMIKAKAYADKVLEKMKDEFAQGKQAYLKKFGIRGKTLILSGSIERNALRGQLWYDRRLELASQLKAKKTNREKQSKTSDQADEPRTNNGRKKNQIRPN